MEPAVIRADPESRLPPRSRRSFGIVQSVRAAWANTAQFILQHPVLFAAVTCIWAIPRFVCLRGLYEAHLGLAGASGLTGGQFARLMVLAVTADAGPVVAAAALMPPQFRSMLDAPPPAVFSDDLRRTGKLLGAVMLLALAAVLVTNGYRLVPLLLLGTLGRTSTILTLILLLPLVVLAEFALLRFSFGLPAIALGLRRPLAEGWSISHGHVLRSAAICALALLPFAAIAGAWLALKPDPLGWTATLLRPVIDTVLVSLTASLTGMFYRAYRLPSAFRPDLRPSRNRAKRREPVFQ